MSSQQRREAMSAPCHEPAPMTVKGGPYRTRRHPSPALEPVRALGFLANTPRLALGMLALLAILLVAGTMWGDRREGGLFFSLVLLPSAAVMFGTVMVLAAQVRFFSVTQSGVRVRSLGRSWQATQTCAAGSRLVVTTAAGVMSLGIPFGELRARRIARAAQSVLDGEQTDGVWVDTDELSQGHQNDGESHRVPSSPWAWVCAGAATLGWVLYLGVTDHAERGMWFTLGLSVERLSRSLPAWGWSRPDALAGYWAIVGGGLLFAVVGLALSGLRRPVVHLYTPPVILVVTEAASRLERGRVAFCGHFGHTLAFSLVTLYLAMIGNYIWWNGKYWMSMLGLGVLERLHPGGLLLLPALGCWLLLQCAGFINAARVIKLNEAGAWIKLDGAWQRITACRSEGLWLKLAVGELPLWCRLPSLTDPQGKKALKAEAQIAALAACVRGRIQW